MKIKKFNEIQSVIPNMIKQGENTELSVIEQEIKFLKDLENTIYELSDKNEIDGKVAHSLQIKLIYRMDELKKLNK